MGDFVLVRYLPNGDLDTSFSGDGTSEETPSAPMIMMPGVSGPPTGCEDSLQQEAANHHFTLLRATCLTAAWIPQDDQPPLFLSVKPDHALAARLLP